MAITFSLEEYSAASTVDQAVTAIKYGSSNSATAGDAITAGNRSFVKNHKCKFSNGSGDPAATISALTIDRTDSVTLDGSATIRLGVATGFTTRDANELDVTGGTADFTSSTTAVSVGAPSGSIAGGANASSTDFVKTQIVTTASSTAGASGITYTFQYTVTS